MLIVLNVHVNRVNRVDHVNSWQFPEMTRVRSDVNRVIRVICLLLIVFLLIGVSRC